MLPGSGVVIGPNITAAATPQQAWRTTPLTAA
jgi:hypothetical protein